VVFWTQPRLAEAFAGLDGALCAAGFNTAHELMYFGVPTALVAQEKVADDQAARVRQLVEAGAVLSASQDLAAVIARLRDPAQAAALRHNAAALVPRNCARQAAAELLDLLLPQSVVRRAVEVLDDQLLGEVRADGLELGDLVDCAVALAGRGLDRAALDLGPARAVLRAARGADVPTRQTARFVGALGRKLCAPDADAEELAEAAVHLLTHPAASGQASALVSLLERLGPERELAPERAAARLGTLLDAGVSAGVDLFRLVDELSRVQAEGELPNHVAIERTRARLLGPARVRA
jgi:hypothetical protein